MEKGEATQLIQVSVVISQPDTREREIRALRKGMKHFGMNKGLVLTYEAEEIIQHKGSEIEVRPVWKWLLNI
jgi:hypothetical protein